MWNIKFVFSSHNGISKQLFSFEAQFHTVFLHFNTLKLFTFYFCSYMKIHIYVSGTYVCECMPHVYECPWLPEVGVRSPSFQALRTFKNRELLKNRKTKMVLQNFKGAKRMNPKSYRFAGLPLQEGNGCHLGGDFICCLINSPCSLIC